MFLVLLFFFILHLLLSCTNFNLYSSGIPNSRGKPLSHKNCFVLNKLSWNRYKKSSLSSLIYPLPRKTKLNLCRQLCIFINGEGYITNLTVIYHFSGYLFITGLPHTFLSVFFKWRWQLSLSSKPLWGVSHFCLGISHV